MKKWEYFAGGVISSNLHDFLNRFGRAGWRLKYLFDKPENFLIVMEREIPDPEEELARSKKSLQMPTNS